MSLAKYRENYQLNAGNASFGEQQTNGLSAGQYTQYFSMTPRGGLPYVLGGFYKFVYVFTATGAETPVSGSDELDAILGGGGSVEVAPAAGGAARGKSLTRQFAEFVWAVATNTSFSVAANPTFASASTSTVTVYLYVPIGGPAAVVKFKLPGAITQCYASGVTVAYTSVTSYIVSTSWSGVVAFNEEKTASLGSGLQSILNYLPQTIAPDGIFMQGESSTTITFASITTSSGFVLMNSTDTDVAEQGAAAIAPVAGATYTTTAGFVVAGNQQAFATFQVQFASATTHFIGYLQAVGGDETPNQSPATTSQPAATSQTGTATATGQVAAKVSAGGSSGPGSSGGGLSLGKTTGGPGGIISKRNG